MLHVEIAQYIAATVDGLAYSESSAEGNVFVDGMPPAPDRVVSVYTIQGAEADSKLPYDPAEFMLIFRCEAGSTWALDRWSDVYSELHGLRNTTLPGGTYLAFCLATSSSPNRLGPDANGRPAYSLSCRTEVINPTAAREAP